MKLGIHLFFLIAAVTLLGAITCIVFACLTSRWLKRCILIVVALFLLAPSGLVLIAFKPELVDARFQTYKCFYRDIKTGMIRSEIMDLMDKHYPLEGKRLRPKVHEDSHAKLSFFMNPEDLKEPNCEAIFLQMEDGKVVEKSYAAD